MESDIEAGLPLISDALYSVPKYHFNVKAANAFAARFYLYYQKWDKVVKHANVVLGSQPEVSLRKWEQDFGDVSLVSDIVNSYISEKKATNLLIVTNYSSLGYYLGPYGIYERYGHGQDIYLNETLSKSGPWSERGGLVMSNIVINNAQKNPFPKFVTFFEYYDKTSGIGFNHTVTVPFTADETLLCRAEACILGEHNYEKALADINSWIKYHSYMSQDKGTDLTVADVNKYYNSILYNPIVVSNPKERSVKKTLNPQGFSVAKGTEENLIQLVLHLRRLETLQEGLRWNDLKRYGIEFSHNVAGGLPEILLQDDDRRAIQIPQDVISAGITANPRSK
jgi:SusD family.